MIKSNGNGSLVIKTWAVLIAAVISLISIGMNISYVTSIRPLNDRVYKIECAIDKMTDIIHSNDKRVTVLEDKVKNEKR